MACLCKDQPPVGSQQAPNPHGTEPAPEPRAPLSTEQEPISVPKAEDPLTPMAGHYPPDQDAK